MDKKLMELGSTGITCAKTNLATHRRGICVIESLAQTFLTKKTSMFVPINNVKKFVN